MLGTPNLTYSGNLGIYSMGYYKRWAPESLHDEMDFSLVRMEALLEFIRNHSKRIIEAAENEITVTITVLTEEQVSIQIQIDPERKKAAGVNWRYFIAHIEMALFAAVCPFWLEPDS